MNFKAILLSVALLTSVNAFAKKKQIHRPHFPLEMTQKEYQQLWSDYQASNQNKNTKAADIAPETQMAIDGGEKFSRWLKAINDNRSAEDQIRLSRGGPSRGGGIPVDRPSKYGKKTIKTRLEKTLAALPASMKEIVYNDGILTTSLPAGIDKETFVQHGRSINFLYQTSVRWTTVILKWMDYFKQRKSQDIRGYYHLRKVTNLDQQLETFGQLDTTTSDKYKKHLTDICINTKGSKGLKKCQSDLDKAIRSNKLVLFKNKYWANSLKIWNSFFDISKPRTDVTWNASSPNVMSIPFASIKDATISNWLKEHVEDEFKNATWNMEVHFKTQRPGMAYLEFKPNVTPHVTGGNIIVMDANTPIEEYSVQWTIRHEFGHILRFPDCYIEFYDEEEEVAVNYQLDVTDLMCSRAGDFNQRIFNEMKRVYFKK